jgi:ribose transport system substrate-binding protein
MSTCEGGPRRVTLEHSRGGGRSRALAGVLVAASTAVVLAGCSSSTGANGGNGAGATTQAQLDAAAANVTQAFKTVDTLPITDPLKNKPTPGKTLVDLRCDATSCTDFDTALKEATAAVGWNLKTIPFKNSDPSTLITAMNDALRFNPSGVVLPGADPKLWASLVPAYEKAKVPLMTLTITGLPKMTSPLVPIGSEPYDTTQGKLIANWFIDDSKGKGKVLLLSLPAYPLFNTIRAGFDNTVKDGCAGCKVSHLDLTIPQLANQQVTSAIISELRKDPSINYVIAESGTFVEGLPAQLGAAGLTGKVTIGGTLARQDNMSDILAGKMKVFTSQAEYVTAWMALDAALRIADGGTLPIDTYAVGAPTQLLNKDNVGTPSASWDSPKDYVNQFKKLWLVN